MNQTRIIENLIIDSIEIGITDKQEIYNRVVLALNIPRPTVRRVARNLRLRFLSYVKVLESELPRVVNNGS